MTDIIDRDHEDPQGLPRDLGDGLTLRWSTQADVDELVQFLGNIFSDEGQFNQPMAYDIYSWFQGGNPATGPNEDLADRAVDAAQDRKRGSHKHKQMD